MTIPAAGICIHCRQLIEAGERCDCDAIAGRHYGSGDGDEGYDYGIRCIEEAVTPFDEYEWGATAA